MLKRFYDYNRESLYINPADVMAVERCDSSGGLSFIRLRDGSKIQVRGEPGEVVKTLEDEDE
jgi:hypothetical protein